METEEPGYIEGPIALGGTVLLCDIQGGAIRRVSDGETTTLAVVGGGPTGLAKGPGNWLYVANNGVPCGGSDMGDRLVSRGFESSGYDARIERADLSTGRIERVLDEVGDWKIEAIDDLVFERENGF